MKLADNNNNQLISQHQMVNTSDHLQIDSTKNSSILIPAVAPSQLGQHTKENQSNGNHIGSVATGQDQTDVSMVLAQGDQGRISAAGAVEDVYSDNYEQ